jgi:hypothetical protein
MAFSVLRRLGLVVHIQRWFSAAYLPCAYGEGIARNRHSAGVLLPKAIGEVGGDGFLFRHTMTS